MSTLSRRERRLLLLLALLSATGMLVALLAWQPWKGTPPHPSGSSHPGSSPRHPIVGLWKLYDTRTEGTDGTVKSEPAARNELWRFYDDGTLTTAKVPAHATRSLPVETGNGAYEVRDRQVTLLDREGKPSPIRLVVEGDQLSVQFVPTAEVAAKHQLKRVTYHYRRQPLRSDAEELRQRRIDHLYGCVVAQGNDQAPAAYRRFKELLAEGADVNGRCLGLNGPTLLETCLVKKELRGRVGELLKAGAKPDAGTGNMTPLLWAILDKEPGLVRQLLDHGACPNLGPLVRPLMLACEGRQLDLVAALLKAGARVNEPSICCGHLRRAEELFDLDPTEAALAKRQKTPLARLLEGEELNKELLGLIAWSGQRALPRPPPLFKGDPMFRAARPPWPARTVLVSMLLDAGARLETPYRVPARLKPCEGEELKAELRSTLRSWAARLGDNKAEEAVFHAELQKYLPGLLPTRPAGLKP